MKQTVAIASFEGFPVSCGTTTRHFPLKVVQTKAFADHRNAEALGEMLLGWRPKGWIQAGQPHGDAVSLHTLDPALPSLSAITLSTQADGLMSLNPAQILSILTADCLPIFFYLEDPRCVGLVHAGWRGTAKRITQKAVSTLKDRFNISVKKLRVAFGPSIRGCCYEVGEELRTSFPESVRRRDGRFYLDLVEENRRQLLEAGYLPQQIGPAADCSGCHLEDFYSYRKEGDRAYRMLSWIVLTP